MPFAQLDFSMRVRNKFLVVILPLVILPVLVTGLTSALAARNEISQIAQRSMEFKAEQLRGYAEGQWRILVENALTDQPQYIAAAQNAVESYAVGLIGAPSEIIFAVTDNGTITFSTTQISPESAEVAELTQHHERRVDGWWTIHIENVPRVAQSAYFQPFDWTFVVTEREDAFYGVIRRIHVQSGTIAAISLALSLLLLLAFVRGLLRPLDSMSAAMRHIMSTRDLSQRVPLFHHDEFGDLGHTFNLMTEDLEQAYDQIRRFAYQAAIARKQEQKVRNVFQRYVPLEVLEQVFSNPESMLVGAKRELAVLFSDIRGFTGISEGMPPDQLVTSLNEYFTHMVDLIYENDGIVDKYIGDAIMAFFGAPVKHDNDALLAVRAGLGMLDTIEAFNRKQIESSLPEFRTGVGISFGEATIGNVGSERKMDYTVMGDMVNLASRLEGLTKVYGVPLLVSQSVAAKVGGEIPCRFVDTVTVRGKQLRTKLYAPSRALSEHTQKGWKLYHAGVKRYYAREFEDARRHFVAAGKLLPNDPLNRRFLSRCVDYLKNPPSENWSGVVEIGDK